MPNTYKVWIEIEEVNEDGDHVADLSDFIPYGALFEESDRDTAIGMAIGLHELVAQRLHPEILPDGRRRYVTDPI